MKKVKAMLVILVIASLFIPIYSVHADVAPPSQPSGSNVVPGEVTMVQMISERVVIDLRPPWSDGIDADVTANFVMRNQGTVDEQMDVGFPLNSRRNTQLDGSVPKLKDLIVKINDSIVTPQYTSDDKWLGNKEKDISVVDWAVFNVLFPVGKDVLIEVNYKQPPTYDYPTTEYGYTLITGAGWYGPIGKGDIIFRLPYTISYYENYWTSSWTSGDENIWGGLNTETIVENEARWHFENIEPENNWGVHVIRPQEWERVLSARQALISNQYDAKLWKELGDAYSNAASEYTNKESFGSSPAAITAYEQSVTLKPDWAEAHACLAREYYKSYRELEFQAGFLNKPPDESLKQGTLQELSVALSLDPNNKTALDLKEEITGEGSGWDILPPPTPFATPTMDANATSTPTEIPFVVTVIQTKLVYAPTTTPKPAEATATISPTDIVSQNENQNGTGTSTMVFTALVIFALGTGAGIFWSKRTKR